MTAKITSDIPHIHRITEYHSQYEPKSNVTFVNSRKGIIVSKFNFKIRFIFNMTAKFGSTHHIHRTTGNIHLNMNQNLMLQSSIQKRE